MDNQKIRSLLVKKEFVERIISVKTPEEVQAEFKKEGAEISLEEVGVLGSLINKSLEKGGKPLSEEDLTEVTGGKKLEVVGSLFAGLLSPVMIPIGMIGKDAAMIAGGAGSAAALVAVATAGAGVVGVAWAVSSNKKKKQTESN